MKTTNESKKSIQEKLLSEIKKDLQEKRYVNPRYYEENVNYFRRQADLMG